MADVTLAKSFLTTGEDYERFRPGFPGETTDAIVPVPVAVALDLGAGTGKFTARLIDRAARVIAVEPSEQMLAVLRKKFPHVEAHVAAAETIPVGTGSVDVVTVAQAFHWFDRDRACAEIHRVLVPGGRLALLWNHSDPDCAWDRACSRVAHPQLSKEMPVSNATREELPHFVLVEHLEFRWRERITRQDYVARWLTVSSLLAASADDRARMVAEIERILDQDPDAAGRAEYDLPQVTDVYIYRGI